MGRIDQAPLLVICDAGPLIHLDELGALDLLADFAEVLVPEAVWREVEQYRPAALTHEGVTLRRITPRMAASPELEALAQVFSLHTGGREALRVAMEHRPDLLLTDDNGGTDGSGAEDRHPRNHRYPRACDPETAAAQGRNPCGFEIDPEPFNAALEAESAGDRDFRGGGQFLILSRSSRSRTLRGRACRCRGWWGEQLSGGRSYRPR